MNAAMVLGSASCLHEDVRALETIVGGSWPGIVVAVNRAALAYKGRIDHWVSLHGDDLVKWQKLRKGNTDYTTWSGTHSPHKDLADRIAPHWRGSSGLLAVSVCFVLEIPRIVLCGVPIDNRGHVSTGQLPHIENRPWRFAHACERDWHAKYQLIRNRVRSMNGFTGRLLGRPTAEWLGIAEEAA